MTPPPPRSLGAAFDLNRLKGPPPGENQTRQQQPTLEQVLIQQGFICACGERIRDEGVVVVRLEPDRLHLQACHSRQCPIYRHEIGRQGVLLERQMPATRWLDEPEPTAPPIMRKEHS